jgi:glycosyltransferase involved in cell wall biosynthesis
MPDPVPIADPALLTLVIPVLNERESLGPLHAEISEVAAKLDRPVEVVFIDDGSTDGSWAIILKLAEADPRVRGIRFRRNFGKAAALAAGFTAARGGAVVTLDADLQDDPHEIPRFLDALREKDVVSGWKKIRHDPWHKVMPSWVFNAMVSRLTGVSLHDHNCGMKGYRREVFNEVKLYGELHRFIPVLARQRGFRVAEVSVPHTRRRFGKSKFGTKRLGNGLLDFIQVLFLTTYLRRPLRLFGAIGALFLAAGLTIGLYMSWLWLNSIPIGTRPLLAAGVLLVITGLQFISTGLVGEMLRNSSFRSGDEYVVRRVL